MSTTDVKAGTIEPSPLKSVTIRKQPHQSRGKASVAKILMACQTVLEIEGPDRVSTKKIAQAANLSTGSIYEYFPNKEAIMCALVEAWLMDIINAIDQGGAQECGHVITWANSVTQAIARVYKSQPIVATFYNSLMAIPELRHIDRLHDDLAAQKYSESFHSLGIQLGAVEAMALAKTILLMTHAIMTDVITHNDELAEPMLANLNYAVSNLLLKNIY